MKSVLFFITVILMSDLSACAQTAVTKINAPQTYNIGDDVSGLPLNKIIRYPARQTTIGALHGKLIILDFWATWCSPCVAAFTKFEEIQKKWPEQVLILPVTSESTAVVEHFFERKKSFSLPSLVEDSTLVIHFPHTVIPHEVIIDAAGKVVAITGSEEITLESIERLLVHQPIALETKKDIMNFRMDMPMLIDSNNGMDHTILFRSMVMPHVEGVASLSSPFTIMNGQVVGFNMVNSLIPHLYLFALNRPQEWMFSRLVMENIQDPNSIRSENQEDYVSASGPWGKKNAYSYDLIAPGLNDAERKTMMLQTLNAFFGQARNLSGSLALRTADAYELRLTGKKIPAPTSDTKVVYTDEEGNETSQQMTMPELCVYIENNIHEPVVDLTRSTATIDITISKTLLRAIKKSDPSALKTLLAEYGLYLVRARRQVEVLLFKKK
ncbi:MAG: DUF3738 domain-containing protein [Flavitalea sp.]